MSMRETSAEAPGRVNLMGEHTDYHQGFVLPTIIPQRTRVYLRARPDRTVHATSRETGNSRQRYVVGEEAVTHSWLDYIQGVTHALRSVTSNLPGFDLHIESDVPPGSGLSSSAALTVSLLRGLRDLYKFRFDDVELAKIAQRAETEFVGAPIGIMDQMACSLGRRGEALFLDTRSLAFERVALPADAAVVVIDSGVRHQHASGAYAVRRRESFAAAKLMGVDTLRDLDLTAIPQIDKLPDPLSRRARHVVTENQRVHETVRAMARNDVATVGALFLASHASMRHDYEVSTVEVDTLVELGQIHPAVYGARLTGGGFGGCVVMLVRAQVSRSVAVKVLADYHKRCARQGTILLT